MFNLFSKSLKKLKQNNEKENIPRVEYFRYKYTNMSLNRTLSFLNIVWNELILTKLTYFL